MDHSLYEVSSMKDSSGLGFQRVNCLLWLWLFLLWAEGGGALWAEEALRIKAIRVEGNQRVDDSVIRGCLESRPGEPYLPGRLGKDIQRINQLGYFEDIQVDLQKHPDGVMLTYWVKERPTLEVLAIEGNQEISTREIEARLGLRLHSVFDRLALCQGVERVRELYRERGYHFVAVEPRVAFLLGNQADLRLTIGEGKRVRIRHIRFTGNRSFQQEELKAVMEIKEKGALSSLFFQDLYLEPRLKADLIRVGDLYADRGFFTSRVGAPRIEMDEERGEVSIAIPIEEGEPQRRDGGAMGVIPGPSSAPSSSFPYPSPSPLPIISEGLVSSIWGMSLMVGQGERCSTPSLTRRAPVSGSGSRPPGDSSGWTGPTRSTRGKKVAGAIPIRSTLASAPAFNYLNPKTSLPPPPFQSRKVFQEVLG